MNKILRFANDYDCEEILSIYSYYVENTAVSFEIEVPTSKAFKERIVDINQKYPYLVVCVDRKIVGYTYASRHFTRAAYEYDVDVSIYVHSDYHGKKIAKALYLCLFDILKEQGFYNIYASYTEPNEKSRKFHDKFDFKLVGTYYKTGFKLGKWHNVTWLEKNIREYDEKPKDIIYIRDLPSDIIDNILYKYNKLWL